MSINHCSLTGSEMQEPVVCIKTGHVYEKRIIQKQIESAGQCPFTGQTLSMSDIVDIKSQSIVRPRPANSTSIPNLLTLLQNEWDALMLETFQLKKHLETVRQELSHALYQHDAACRVIARLVQERDEAQNQVSQLIQSTNQSQSLPAMKQQEAAKMEIEQNVLPANILQDINDLAVQLNTNRRLMHKKGSTVLDEYISQETIANLRTKWQVPLHSTTKPGITCMDVHPSNEQYLVTGGNDGQTILFDSVSQQVINMNESYKKRVNAVKFVRNSSETQLQYASCSQEKKAQLFQFDFESKQHEIKYSISDHSKEITDIDLHPINYLLACSAKDHSWSYHDISVGRLICKIDAFDEKMEFNTIRFHPDGHIFAVGANDGTVKLWNLQNNQLVEQLEGFNGSVNLIQFSENGFHFATSNAASGIVKIWDLRKLNVLKNLFEQNKEEAASNKIGCFSFDQSGKYFATGSQQSINIFSSKNWEEIAKLKSHTDLITSIKFGKFSKTIYSSSLDRNLILYGL